MPTGISPQSFFIVLINRLKNTWLNLRFFKKAPENLAKKQILILTASKKFPTWKQWLLLPRILSNLEKKILQGSFLIITVSFITLGSWFLVSRQTELPAVGGEYTEGLIGSPQFINPLYALTNDVDSDLTHLIYSGLFRWNQENGLVPDLAESYSVSEDQKTYTIKLRDNAKWHNGDPVRSSDILFTIQTIQNPSFHSPLAISFRGVTVSEVDELSVQFVLEESFAPFLSSLTVGILPSNIWSEVSPKNATLTSLNLSPIGSGPYKFEKYTLEKSGEIKSYTLIRNPEYYGESAKIERLNFKFYNDAQSAVSALENQNVEGLSFVPNYLVAEVEKNRSVSLLSLNMPQIVALFFNENNQPLLKNENIKQALALSLNKEEIINEILKNNGAVIDSPLLPNELGYDSEIIKIKQDVLAAIALIDKTDYSEISPDGFRAKKIKKTENGETIESLEELTLKIITISQPSFIQTAEIIARQAKTIGIKIEIETAEPSFFYDDVIKPRAYQILLTAIQYGLDPDPYPFWHSSQIKDPGLNLSFYNNRQVDELLEKARVTNNNEERAEAYKEFQKIIAEDLPAIFLYQPTYAYAISNKVKNLDLKSIKTPADRFQNISDWYIKTKQVFK